MCNFVAIILFFAVLNCRTRRIVMAETNTTLCKWRDIQIEVIEKGQDG